MLLYLDTRRAPNPRKMRIYLAEKGLPLPIKELDLYAGAQRSAEFLQKNPFAGVPILELDDGTVIAESLAQAKDAAEKVVTDFEVLPAVIDPAQAQRAAQIHEVAPNNTIYNWHIGDPAANDAAMKTAKHVTRLDFINNRLVPNAIEPRAAMAEYDAGTDHLTLWNTTQNPHVARLVIEGFVGMAALYWLGAGKITRTARNLTRTDRGEAVYVRAGATAGAAETSGAR